MCGSKFAEYNHTINNVLRTHKVLHSIGYKINELSRILHDNKGFVLLAYGMSMIIKKYSIALVFYKTREAIIARAVEI